MKRRAVGLFLLACLSACVDAGQAGVAFPLDVAGTEPREVSARGGWLVELERAELAFGPLYLCASGSAGEHCDEARAEWLDSVVLDALDPEAREVGSVHGVEGEVRSYMCELGMFWPLSATGPRATAAGEQLDGSSVTLSGVARRDDTELPFEAVVVVAPNGPGVAVASEGVPAHYLDAQERGALLTFDVSALVADVDFDVFVTDDGAPASDPPATFEPDTQPYRAVAGALVTDGLPRLSWGSQ